jgi:hypothetical protein
VSVEGVYTSIRWMSVVIQPTDALAPGCRASVHRVDASFQPTGVVVRPPVAPTPRTDARSLASDAR